MMSLKEKKEPSVEAGTFRKEQIAASRRYREKRDLIEALLVDGKNYSLEQVENLLDKYAKGMVK